jgi:FKBP-type peptidyl-prolyl cis-trans isomerase
MPLLDISPPALAAAANDDCQLKTAENGMQWCTITEGDGPAPVKGAMIKAHYAGKLFNSEFTGTFDSSYDRGRPLSFAVGTGQVIRGWDLGILGDNDLPPMKKNEKRRLVIPPELGYGARGAGGVIPPNATLDFVVEYLGRLGQQ